MKGHDDEERSSDQFWNSEDGNEQERNNEKKNLNGNHRGEMQSKGEGPKYSASGYPPLQNDKDLILSDLGIRTSASSSNKPF